jgi:hypothetical protein
VRTEAVLAVVLAVAACSPKAETPVAPQPAPQSAPPVTTVENPATVRGVVRWTGAPAGVICPDPVGGVPESFHEAWGGDVPPQERFATAADGGLPHTLVWAAEGPHRSMRWPQPAEPFELRIRAAMFVPHVFGVRRGQRIRLSTEDTQTYRPRTAPSERPGSPSVVVTRGQPADLEPLPSHGPVRCVDDIHSWMDARACAFDHPFFATTDAQGRFEITGLPPGEYVFKVWHEPMRAAAQGHEAETRVTLASGARSSLDFELR